MTKIIEMKNVNKTVKSENKEKKILNDVSISIEENSITVLAGLNGAGKTTMIKSILDLTSYDNGEILIYGKTHKRVENRQVISYLPEKFYCNKKLKGIDYLEFYISLSNQEIDEKYLKELLRIMNLDDTYLGKKIGAYSKGMMQKLGILSVLLSKTPILILDEPFSGLDLRSREELYKIIKKHHNEGGSILFTSHILENLSEFCTDAVIIHDGKIDYHGPTKEISVLDHVYSLIETPEHS